MAILVITWNFPPRRGGIEYVISNICDGLRQRQSVAVVTAYFRAPGLRENGVFRAPWPGLSAFGLYALWRGAWLLLRDPGKRIIFGGSALVTPLVLVLARLFGRKAVVQTHGLDLIYDSALYQLLCVRWLKRCDHVIANSAYTAALARNVGVLEARITVIAPGVDAQRFAIPQDFEAIKRRLGFEQKRIILFVGRLAKRKGVKEFIEKSFPYILREIPSICFVVVGDNPLESLAHRGDALNEIKQAVAQLGMQRDVRLLGAVSDEQLAVLYKVADVVVLPALAAKADVEGFGIVLLEAAAAATPAVATRVGGIPDAVEDGMGGILVEPGDYKEMARVLIKLLRDDELRRRLGRYGSNWVQERFTWPKIIATYERTLGLEPT